jgi:hypothetical protein
MIGFLFFENASVLLRAVSGSDNILAVFSNGELRGVSTPIFALDKWIYFLTVYGNQNGEDLHLKLYDTASLRILPINFNP